MNTIDDSRDNNLDPHNDFDFEPEAEPATADELAGLLPRDAVPVRGQQQATELREAIRAALRTDKLSQATLAKQLGYGKAAMSAWLSGTYEGDNAAVAAKASKWLSSRRNGPQDRRLWIDTPTAEKIVSALAFAQINGDMVAIYGGPGVGKTSAIKRYMQLYPGCGWHATIRPGTSGLVSALQQVGDAVGVGDTSGGARQLGNAIQSQVADTCGVIIIDEAQHLTMAAVEEIRAIHDATDIGIAFVGNETSYARLVGGTRAAHYAQIHSRLALRLRLAKPTPRDVRQIAALQGVTDKHALAFLERLSQKPGALRIVVKCMRIVAASGEEINEQTLRRACRILGVEA